MNPSMLRAIGAAGLAAAVLGLTACAGPQGGRGAPGPSAGAPGDASPPAARRGGGYYLDDGPGANPPADLAAIPDAVPRAEPLLPRTLRPYSVFGKRYVPMTRVEPFRERGMASWYGRRYHGQPTSSGEPYDMYAMTAAHPTLPIPSYVRVTHLASGRSVVVRVNDRGPFLQNRVIDLSYTAAARLGYIEAGSAEVEVELFTRFDAAGAPVAEAASPASGSAIAAPVVATGGSAPPVPAPSGGAASSGAAASSGTTASAPVPPAPVAAPPAANVAAEPVRLSIETVHAAPGTPPVPAGGPAQTGALASASVPVPPPAAPAPASASASASAPASASGPASLPAPAPATAPVPASPGSAGGFWLQFGAFTSLENARSAMAGLARRLDFLEAAFDIRRDGGLYKVQAGPWPRREDAAAAAGRVRARTDLRPFATLR